MIAAALVAGLLVATAGAPHQNDTQRLMQVEVAKGIAKTVEPGDTPEQVAAKTGRLTVPSTALVRCIAGGQKCAAALDEKAATKRIDTWQVSDHTLVVVYCGGVKAWRVAGVDLSTADRPDPLGEDRRAVVLKKDDALAKACTVE
jgi:hypothetical protein